MDSKRELQWIALANSLEIESDVVFRFHDRRYSVHQPPWSLPPHADVSPRERLTHAVALVLYHGAYCGGPAERDFTIPEGLAADEHFTEKLSTANQTRRSSERGWQLVDRQPDGSIQVTKAGRFRIAAIGEYQLQDPDGLYALTVRREERTWQPMCYFALSETLPNQRDDRDNVRFYFHCDSVSVLAVMQSVTGLLNRHRTPFRIKCFNQPRLFDRADALVLYIEKRYFSFVARGLKTLAAQGAFHLRAGVPLFTKQLIPGIGIAEDPGTGQSFGQQRTRCLAEALLRASDLGCLDNDQVLTQIRNRFGEAGVDLDASHLNAGSVDWYEVPPQPAANRKPTQHNTYLDAASAIGRLLVRDAVWAGDQCNWLTQTTFANADDGRSIVTACGADGATGTPGIKVFLSQLMSIQPDPLTAAVLSGVRQQIASCGTPATNREDANSLHTTWAERIKNEHPSVNHSAQLQRMFAEYCRGIFSHQAHCPAQLAARMIQQGTMLPSQHVCFIDPLSADAFLTIAAAAADPAWLEAADRIADHVLAQTNHHDQPWRAPPDRELAPWGLADGLSGVGYFLLRIAVPSIPPLLSSTCDL